MFSQSNFRVFEIAFMARVAWDLHSLNNEGTVGNVTEPRTVVLADGTKTDGISGEMLKHIHSYNVWLLQGDKSGFCEACQKLHPQKADRNTLIERTDAPAIAMEKAISSCILCDLHGFLVQRPAVARASTVEFGWALSIPGLTNREIHIHARHSLVGRAREEIERESAEATVPEERREREVTAQMLYHRPTRSGVYALVSVFQPWRIGLNEVDYTYVIDENARRDRYELALNAYKAALIRTDGAMISTRLPHTQSVEGMVVVSKRNFPVPVLSPLREDYLDQIQSLVESQDGFSIHAFDSLTSLCNILDDVASQELYSLTMPA